MLDVELDGRCECSSAIDALNRDRQDVYDECQHDAETDDVDVKQVAEHVVRAGADSTAKMMKRALTLMTFLLMSICAFLVLNVISLVMLFHFWLLMLIFSLWMSLLEILMKKLMSLS